tara:strand:+ start:10 stop:180 length:171 start_codon:yes stop_codon:yes gene_type:complete
LSPTGQVNCRSIDISNTGKGTIQAPKQEAVDLSAQQSTTGSDSALVDWDEDLEAFD